MKKLFQRSKLAESFVGESTRTAPHTKTPCKQQTTHQWQPTMAHPPTKRVPISGIRTTISVITAFLFGLALASAFFLWHAIHSIEEVPASASLGLSPLSPAVGNVRSATNAASSESKSASEVTNNSKSDAVDTNDKTSILSGLRILVTIASFDFMQLAHLEEVLDGFQDVCYAGSKVDIVIYTTVVVSIIWGVITLQIAWIQVYVLSIELASQRLFCQSFRLASYFLGLFCSKYPVALIDMLNDRMRCNDPSSTSGMTVTLMLKPASVRLHLVDFHRTLFYERLDSYDLFVYTEVSSWW